MSAPLDTLPECPGLRLDDLLLTTNAAVALVISTAPTAACPYCGTPSDRVHSRYRRTAADLPCHGRPLTLRLVVRRFRCIDPGCPQAIFCERLPELLDARARTTARLTGAHRAIGFALGGEAGARLADHLDMPTSPDTLLRRVKGAAGTPAPPPRYVGVDDWALRKGQRYGTIVVDLERGRVIDLFPGRDGTALETWLKEHPGVEVVSRDRWAAYAQAATAGAPQAEQVADRWHLLKNLREAIEKLFDRHYDKLKPALQALPAAPEVPAPATLPAEEATIAPLEPAGQPPAPASPRSAKRQRRVERYERVRQLREAGTPMRQIARELAMSVKTVRRYAQGAGCPDWKPGRQRPTRVDAYADQIDRRIAAGCRNAAEIYRELAAQGCGASACAVRRFFNRRLAAAGQTRERANAAAPAAPAPPSPRKLSFDLIRRPEKRKPEEQQRLDRIRAVGAEVAEAIQLADEFVAMVRERSGTKLADWITRATEAGAPEVCGFAGGLRQDEAAVKAGLTQSWSNGPVEGQVNRLKVIKRAMYGRAGFALLKARVLHVA
jgi:transposase